MQKGTKYRNLYSCNQSNCFTKFGSHAIYIIFSNIILDRFSSIRTPGYFIQSCFRSIKTPHENSRWSAILESLSFALYVKRQTPGKEKFYWRYQASLLRRGFSFSPRTFHYTLHGGSWNTSVAAGRRSEMSYRKTCYGKRQTANEVFDFITLL